jgi:chromosome segregation ATPase
MPDVYAKGQPHVPVADIGGHFVGMHAPERPEVFTPEKLWWRGDDYAEALRQRDAFNGDLVARMARVRELETQVERLGDRWVQQDREILALISDRDGLRNQVLQLQQARDLSAQASATMCDESIAKSEVIKELEERARLLKGQVADLIAHVNECETRGGRRPPKRAGLPP